jgi:hypothetical protein
VSSAVILYIKILHFTNSLSLSKHKKGGGGLKRKLDEVRQVTSAETSQLTYLQYGNHRKPWQPQTQDHQQMITDVMDQEGVG